MCASFPELLEPWERPAMLPLLARRAGRKISTARWSLSAAFSSVPESAHASGSVVSNALLLSSSAGLISVQQVVLTPALTRVHVLIANHQAAH